MEAINGILGYSSSPVSTLDKFLNCRSLFNQKNDLADISGDLSGYLDDEFWTRRHAELQQRILRVESLKEDLLTQLRQRRDTLASFDDARGTPMAARAAVSVDAVPSSLPANVTAAPPPTSSVVPSAHLYDLSTIFEGDSSLTDSKLDSFFGRRTSAVSTTHDWRALTSETLTSMESGKLSR